MVGQTGIADCTISRRERKPSSGVGSGGRHALHAFEPRERPVGKLPWAGRHGHRRSHRQRLPARRAASRDLRRADDCRPQGLPARSSSIPIGSRILMPARAAFIPAFLASLRARDIAAGLGLELDEWCRTIALPVSSRQSTRTSMKRRW
jgi:hypothetical protein